LSQQGNDDVGFEDVVYSLNFGGGPRKARLIPAALIRGDANYHVRDVRTRQYVAPDSRKARKPWSPADLAKGIPTSLPAQDPELFLIERTNLAPLELKGLATEQSEALKWAWRPSPPARHRLLVNGYHVGEFRVSKPKMPTAVKALEDAGWEVNSMISRLEDTVETLSSKGITQEKLDSYQVLAFIGLHHGTSVWRSEEINPNISRQTGNPANHDGITNSGITYCLWGAITESLYFPCELTLASYRVKYSG